MKYAPLVFRNLWRNRRRTLLTTLSIAVSLFVFSTLMSMPTLVNQIMKRSASSLRIHCHNRAGFFHQLPESYKPRIAALPHVTAVVGDNYFGGIYHTPADQFGNIAMDHEQLAEMWPEWGISRAEMAEFSRSRTACLVTKDLMRRFGWQLGRQIMLRGTIYPVDLTFQIVGTLSDEAPPNFMIFRRDYLQEAIGRTDLVNAFWVRADLPESIPTVIAEIDRSFANSAYETESEAEATLIESMYSQVGALFAMARYLAAIVIVTIGLVAANTAAMSIRERRKDIALLRALGFSGRVVLSCLLSECFLMGLAGWLVGCVGAYLVLKTVPIGMPALTAYVARMPLAVLGKSLLVAIAIGLLSGLIPALPAVRRNIVEGMRVA